MARNIWLVLTFTFFGPLVGAVAELVVALAADPILSGSDSAGIDRLLSTWPFIISVGYALGLAPAFLSAIAMIIATRWLPTLAARLVAGALIGAVVSTALIGLFMLLSEMGNPADLWILLLVAIPGAVAAFVSLALVELFHPPAEARLMHLLSAQAGALQQDGEAIDLAQTPADIVFASAADSELMMLAAAADRAGADDLRLANLLRLSHNLSVDMWLDQTVRHARLVVIRLLGGPAYWPYGIDELTALTLSGGPRLAILPGDATPDPILQSRSTIDPQAWTKLHSLFTAGGPENADALRQAFQSIIDGSPAPAEVRPFPRFGLWHPALGMVPELPASPHLNAPILFYRAALEGAGTATLEALIAELEAQHLNPVPLVISTLKEGACLRFVQRAFEAYPPDVILNLTGFALGLDGLDPAQNPFADTDAPVIQLIQSGRPEAQWSADPQGLTAKDLAMQVVLPELDGRHGMLLVGHKQEAVWHERTQCPLSAYAPDEDGISRAVTLAKNWTTLRATPRAERRVAIVLANYPIRDGRLANGVGYDVPQSTVEILKSLQTAGFSVGEPLPPAGRGTMRSIVEGGAPRCHRPATP